MKDFILPDIGEGIVECELLKWLVAEGETVKEDQPVAEVMTDKATVEIPAMDDGIIAKHYYKEGEIAKVHQPLFAMTSASDDTNSSNTDVPTPVVNENKADNSQPNLSQVESFILPDIGEGIVECEIMQWHVSEGDSVLEDQVVVEVMTDKAVVEIPAKYAGKVSKLHYQKGDIAAVHSPLFDQVLASSELTNSAPAPQSEIVEPNEHNPQSGQATKSTHSAHSENMDASAYAQGEQFSAPVDVGRALASPAVRRLAREYNVQLSAVKASGNKGRVLKQDLMKHINAKSPSMNTSNDKVSTTSATNQQAPEQTALMSPTTQQDKTEAIKGIRAAMAKQMTQSVQNVVHFSVSDELCMDALVALRAKLKVDFEKQSVKLSFLPFFIKALSLAMQAFPIINSRANKEFTELTYLGSHNIGVAVDSKLGLLVPNIKSVEKLSIFEVAQALNTLVEKGREGKLSKSDLSGGTVSISNIGAIGGMTATPIINEPEVAIVALGKTQTLPRFDEQGNVRASKIMMVNWSGDHRIIDGATMVRFNNLWMSYLQEPERMLVNMR